MDPARSANPSARRCTRLPSTPGKALGVVRLSVSDVVADGRRVLEPLATCSQASTYGPSPRWRSEFIHVRVEILAENPETFPFAE